MSNQIGPFWGVLHSRPAIWGGPTHPTPHPDLSGPEEGAGEGKPTPQKGRRESL